MYSSITPQEQHVIEVADTGGIPDASLNTTVQRALPMARQVSHNPDNVTKTKVSQRSKLSNIMRSKISLIILGGKKQLEKVTLNFC